MKKKGLNKLTGFILVVMGLLCLLGSQMVFAQSVIVTEDQTVKNKFTRHTVTGITTPLPEDPNDGEPGFMGAAFLTIGNIDQDPSGIKEIICSGGIYGTVAIFTWDGSDMDTWTQTVVADTLNWPNGTVLRDMDGDGDNDIMVMDNFITNSIFHNYGIPGHTTGIYYLENLGGDIKLATNWVLQTIYDGAAVVPTDASSFHDAYFMDVDGDGKEDFITSKFDMQSWFDGVRFTWTQWFKKEGNPGDPDYGTNYSGPYDIGEGGGTVFLHTDVDSDGDLDLVMPQFFVTISGAAIVRPWPDILGDSIIWFENPGIGTDANSNGIDDVFETWNMYHVDHSLGKGIEVIEADMDNDGEPELVFSNHNSQYADSSGNQVWPSGVYYLEFPDTPTDNNTWPTVVIEQSDPSFPADGDPAADVYAIDRFGDWTNQGSPGLVRAADMTGDGYPELVVPGDGKGAVYYYEAKGPGASSSLEYDRATLYYDPGCMPGEAEIDDIDNDGDLDIISVIWDTSYQTKTGNDYVTDPESPAYPQPQPTDSYVHKSSSIFIFEDILENDTIIGTVSGDTAAGVEITLSKLSCGAVTPIVLTTDGSGNYSSAGLESGTYRVEANKEGYSLFSSGGVTPAVYWVTIPQASPQSYDFTAVAAVTLSQLDSAAGIDNDTAEYAQKLFGDIDELSGVSVIAVNEGSNFITSKASVDNSTDTVTARYTLEPGTLPEGSILASANAITLLKTRTPEAIEYITEVEYTSAFDSAGTCQEVNQDTYIKTRALLTEQQRNKYDNEGYQLSFIADTVDGQGGDWLPSDPYALITDNGTHLLISSSALASDFDPAVQDDPGYTANVKNQYGVRYCKTISSQNMLLWMTENAFDETPSLVVSDPTPVITCDDVATSVGSCYWHFYIPGFVDTYFCEDFIGSDYTGGVGGTAETKCLDVREGVYVDGVVCADRTDIAEIDTTTGLCAISETDEGAYTWTQYAPDDENDCPRRFFTCDE